MLTQPHQVLSSDLSPRGKDPTDVGNNFRGVGTHPTDVGDHFPHVGKFPTSVGHNYRGVGRVPTGIGNNVASVGRFPTGASNVSRDRKTLYLSADKRTASKITFSLSSIILFTKIYNLCQNQN